MEGSHIVPAWIRRELTLRPHNRGFHLITREVVGALPELRSFRVGVLHIFLMHTSAGLTLNENASPEVLLDLEDHFNEIVPENRPYLRHTIEGADDMPAHVKSSLLGASLSIPVGDGRLLLGTWQGIMLCEHRQHGGARRLVLTLHGEQSPSP